MCQALCQVQNKPLAISAPAPWCFLSRHLGSAHLVVLRPQFSPSSPLQSCIFSLSSRSFEEGGLFLAGLKPGSHPLNFQENLDLGHHSTCPCRQGYLAIFSSATLVTLPSLPEPSCWHSSLLSVSSVLTPFFSFHILLGLHLKLFCRPGSTSMVPSWFHLCIGPVFEFP